MILNTISLHNFMSYADCRLDLTSVNVACLSGLNGAGKSALLDAVTWAIWENARSGSDELIRMGQTEMWVDLTFELEGDIYRIRRSRQRSAARPGAKIASRAALEFQIFKADLRLGDGEEEREAQGTGRQGSWASLSAPGVRETQNRICQTLRMDYDTFINSVYLRQGRADEFTTRPPGERKQVLGEILGLSYFDRLQELAREEARALKAQIEVLQGALAPKLELEAEIGIVVEAIESLRLQLSDAGKKVALAEERLAALKAASDELRLSRSGLEAAARRRGELEADLDMLKKQNLDLDCRLGELTMLQGQEAEIKQKVQEFNLLKERVEQLDGISLEIQDLQNQRSECRSTLANLAGRMEVEIEHLKQTVTLLGDRKLKLEKESGDQEKLEAAYHKYKELLKEESEQSRKQESFSQLSARADQLHSAVAEARVHMEAEVEQKSQAIIELESLIKSRSSLVKEQEELKARAEQLEKLEAEFDLVEESGLKVKSDIEATHAQIKELKRRCLENEGKVKELRQTASSSICPLCASPIVDRTAVMDRYHIQNHEIESEIQALASQIEDLESKRSHLRHRYSELRARLETRKALDMRIGEFNARMSALERADANCQALVSDVETLKRRLGDKDFAQVERESLIALRAEIHKLDFDPVIYANLQSQLRMQRHTEARYQKLLRDLEELRQLKEEVPGLEEKINSLSLQLQADDFAPDVRLQVRVLDEKIALLNYDRNLHQELRLRLAQLLPFLERLKDVERAARELPAVQQAHAACGASIDSKEKEHLQLCANIAAWEEKLSSMPELDSELAETQSEKLRWLTERDEIDRSLAVATSRLAHLEAEKDALAAKQSRLGQSAADLNDYNFLAEALGKKGIQALIIENIVPEIESEANHILSRLSENQMHLALITQHKTRQGATQETLDIVIADDVGTRNYELYSGGEAFKINFAIRVALSRLLARRAGARLQSLIIDEGFGSQDEASRYRLIKAINSIKNDFARILVITHISEMKELFPVQIAVTKEDGISNLQVLF